VALVLSGAGAGAQVLGRAPRPPAPHPLGLCVGGNCDEAFAVYAQAISKPPTRVFSGQMGTIKMVYSGEEYSNCPQINLGTIGNPAPYTIFQETLPSVSAGTRYVDVQFTTNLNLYPGTAFIGVAVNCVVEQDLTVPPDGVYETQSYCSGVSPSVKPWLVFMPSTDPVGSAFQTTFRGYAQVTALNSAGNPVPTRVTITLLGVEWANQSSGGAAYACNNTLKIEY